MNDRERKDILRIIGQAQTPLAGFHLADRNHFAAFNMGRIQQRILMDVEHYLTTGKRRNEGT